MATISALPGCVWQGQTRRQGLRNAKEAIEAYIEALLHDGFPVPTQTDSEMVAVELSARWGHALREVGSAKRGVV